MSFSNNPNSCVYPLYYTMVWKSQFTCSKGTRWNLIITHQSIPYGFYELLLISKAHHITYIMIQYDTHEGYLFIDWLSPPPLSFDHKIFRKSLIHTYTNKSINGCSIFFFLHPSHLKRYLSHLDIIYKRTIRYKKHYGHMPVNAIRLYGSRQQRYSVQHRHLKWI